MKDSKVNEQKAAGDDVPIVWDESTREKFQLLIEKIPIFLRGIAKDKVALRAERLVKKDNRTNVCEKDMVDAFFEETPFGFHGPMKTDMEQVGIDYVQYGYPK